MSDKLYVHFDQARVPVHVFLRYVFESVLVLPLLHLWDLKNVENKAINKLTAYRYVADRQES